MQAIRGIFLGVLSLIITLSAGKNAVAGCEKDTDCKGDRVCFEGKCMTPEGAAEKAAVPAAATPGVAPASPSSPTPGVAPAPPASGVAAPANYPPQPGGAPPQLNLAEIDYRQVAWTLKTPLRDEYEDYRTQSTIFVDGFAGFMLKKAKLSFLTSMTHPFSRA
jgi:hypothetical protein